MKASKTTAFSLVEVLIVVAILSVIAVTGYRSLMYLTKEATQTSRAAANSRRAEYDRFVGVLNDRLSRSWSYIAETTSAQGLNGSILHLYNADGQNFADFGIYTDGTIYRYQIADTGEAAPLNLEYAFTNQNQTLDYALTFRTNAAPGFDVTASWKVPPPLYYRAATLAFRGLFVSADDSDLEQQVSEHRTNKTGLLQHDLRQYTFNPRHDAFR
jgi:prepilin-type N-terminal cleavage/methylation domain-containing protein